MTGAADPPLVDVGVVTWNTREVTVGALRRLLDDTVGVRLRLLVHDNASTDGTAEAIRQRVPEAELEVGPVNVGFAAGVNLLLGRSSAEWFLTLNSDAWPHPDAVARLVECLHRRPRAAAAAPRLERPDGRLEPSAHPFPSPLVAIAAGVGLRGRWAAAHALPGAWEHDRERRVDWAVGAALLLRRKAVEEVGGLDETFFMYAEDLEWCHRAARHGWETWFTPAARVVHVGNASGAKRYGDDRTRAWIRNTYRFYRRDHGAVGTAALQAANALGAAATGLRAARRGDRAAARYWRDHARTHLRRG